MTSRIGAVAGYYLGARKGGPERICEIRPALDLLHLESGRRPVVSVYHAAPTEVIAPIDGRSVGGER